MLPGQYQFKTESRELMEIISGKLHLKLQTDDDWKLIGDSMNLSFPKIHHLK